MGVENLFFCVVFHGLTIKRHDAAAGLFDDRLGVPTVVCGPGSMAQGHKPDEFIERSQLEKCDAMLDRLIERLST